MGFEGYTLVACGHHRFGRVVSSDAHPEARDDWSRERDDDARGETRERGRRPRSVVRSSSSSSSSSTRARARGGSVRLERGRRVRSFVRSSVATVLNPIATSIVDARERDAIDRGAGARNRGRWRRARRDELREAVAACRARGLKHAAAWACEQLYGLDDGGDATTSGGGLAASGLDVMGMDDTYSLAMAYFDLGEYRRCAHTLRDARAPLPTFLREHATF